MSQIMYNLPGDARPRRGHVGLRLHVTGAGGADIASEQAALSNAWQGDTGMTYQVWQAQWNEAMEQLVPGLPGDVEHSRIQHVGDVCRDAPSPAAKWGG